MSLYVIILLGKSMKQKMNFFKSEHKNKNNFFGHNNLKFNREPKT